MLIEELREIVYENFNCEEILNHQHMNTIDALKILNLRNSNGNVPHLTYRIISCNVYLIRESLLNGYYDPSDNTVDKDIIEKIEEIRTVRQLKDFLVHHKTDWYRNYLGYYVEWL